MIQLKTIQLKPAAREMDGYPFTLPLIRHFREIEFRAPVTFLVGENGSGKSTLIEALAAAIGSIAVGSDDLERDATLHPAKALGKQLKLAWNHKSSRGFFLRAEDFFGFARRMHRSMQDLEEIARSFENDYSGAALQRAQGYVRGQKRALEEKYGENPDAFSHGESFLNLFQERFVPGGLYLLDEPEAPLSPQRQLALLSMLKEMIEQKAQFIIATHSPILMAFPEAVILSLDGQQVREVGYDDLEHVTLMRAFLDNPSAYLRHL